MQTLRALSGPWAELPVTRTVEHGAGPAHAQAVPLVRLAGKHDRILGMFGGRVQVKRNAVRFGDGFLIEDEMDVHGSKALPDDTRKVKRTILI